MSEESTTFETSPAGTSIQWLLANVNTQEFLGMDHPNQFTFEQVRDTCEDLGVNPILLEQAIRSGGTAFKGKLLQMFYEVLVETIAPSAQSETPAQPEPYPNEASIREATRILSEAHTHSFTYALNANHTALRGCSCGLSFVGHMVGVQPGELRWHRVKEENEE